MALALELANTIDMLEDPLDFLRDLERLERFLRHVRNDAAEERLTQAHLDDLRELRDALIRAMDADKNEAAALLAELAATFDLRPRLVISKTLGISSWDRPPRTDLKVCERQQWSV